MSAIENRRGAVEKELFDRYDRLNALIEKEEQELTSRHIPHDVEFCYYSPLGEAEDNSMALAIGVTEVNGKLRLCHQESHYEKGIFWTPLVDCLPHVRVNVARFIPK